MDNCCRFKQDEKKKALQLKKFVKDHEFLNNLAKYKAILGIIKRFYDNKINDNFKEQLAEDFKIGYIDLEGKTADYDICDKCSKYYIGKTFSEIVFKEEVKEKEEEFKILTISELIKEVKKDVMAQDILVKDLATIFYMHQLKINKKLSSMKSVIPLVVGNTGTGKTLAIRKFAKLIDVPFISLSAGSFTADGWSGNDVVEFFKQHRNHKNFNNSIVYIDEIDKIHLGDSQIENVNRLKQYRLLTFVEGEESLDSGGCTNFSFSTEHMQFIFSGSYQEVIKERKNEIGFLKKEINGVKEITKSELVKHGMIPEFAGRISNIIPTNDLTKEDFKEILMKSEAGYLNYYDEIMNSFGVKMDYQDSFYESIAAKAFNSEFGARELSNYLFDFFKPLIQECSSVDIGKICDTKKFNFKVSDTIYTDCLKKIVKEIKVTKKKVKTKKKTTKALKID